MLYAMVSMSSMGSAVMTESSVSVIIPVFNAERYINELYRELKTVLSEQFNRFEIIFVDDASSDGSGDAVHAIAEADPSCTAVSLSENVGQQKATFCGLQYTSGEYVVTIDDDGQYAPDDIIRLHEMISEQELDCVYGIPVIRSRRLIRRLGTWLTDRSLSRLTGKAPSVKVRQLQDHEPRARQPGPCLSLLCDLPLCGDPEADEADREPPDRTQA